MKTYIITAGEFEYYHICGVETDREKAEKILKIYSGSYGGARIETYTVGAYDDYLDHDFAPYKVWFDKSGNLIKVKISEQIHGPYPSFRDLTMYTNPDVPAYEILCFAKNSKHAEKVACDILKEKRPKQLKQSDNQIE